MQPRWIFAGTQPEKLPLNRASDVAREDRPVFCDAAGISLILGNSGGSSCCSDGWAGNPWASHSSGEVSVRRAGGKSSQSNWSAFLAASIVEGYCAFRSRYFAMHDLEWPISAGGGMKRVEPCVAKSHHFRAGSHDAPVPTDYAVGAVTGVPGKGGWIRNPRDACTDFAVGPIVGGRPDGGPSDPQRRINLRR